MTHGLLARLRARAKGQVSASVLDAHRRAGADVPGLLDDAETALGDTWKAGYHEQVVALCAWNAFVCQLVANCILDAESYEDRATAGFVPPGVAREASLLYEDAEAWRERASAARASRAYELDVRVPDTFPLWIDADQCAATTRGLLWALRGIAARRASLERFIESAPSEQWEVTSVLTELFERVVTAGEYGAAMWSDEMSSEVRAEVTERLLGAIANAYVLGQLVAMPTLAESRRELAATLDENRVIHSRRAVRHGLP